MNMKDFELKETSLDQIEQQLNEITFQRQNHSKQINLIHGSYIGLSIISISLVVYLCRSNLMASLVVLGNCFKKMCPATTRTTQYNFPNTNDVPQVQLHQISTEEQISPSTSSGTTQLKNSNPHTNPTTCLGNHNERLSFNIKITKPYGLNGTKLRQALPLNSNRSNSNHFIFFPQVTKTI